MKLAKLGDGPEIFHTIQGEGVSAGLAAVFIRLSRCNLHCVWCDTDHTWNFEGTPWSHEKDTLPGYSKHQKAAATYEMSPAEAAEEILRFNCKRVVITGGEPLLQEKEALEMVRHLRAKMADCMFEVETNATRIPSPEFVKAVDQFNVSPKLANSAMPESLRIHENAMRFFAESPKAWFKFVISNPEDISEIRQLCSRFGIHPERILLMPEGRTAADLDRSAPAIAELCRESGYRFCDRLHIRLWGDRRGV